MYRSIYIDSKCAFNLIVSNHSYQGILHYACVIYQNVQPALLFFYFQEEILDGLTVRNVKIARNYIA